VTISFSDNHGLDWTNLTRITQSGEYTLDLKKQCFRSYDYQLKLELAGAGTGLDALRITHDIQHSQAPLPALLAGDNTITFTAGPASRPAVPSPQPTAPPPPEAKVRASVRCALCGERFMESRGRVKDGKIVCMPCFEQREGLPQR